MHTFLRKYKKNIKILIRIENFSRKFCIFASYMSAYATHTHACSTKDHKCRKAIQYERLLRSVRKGLVARRDTVGGVIYLHWKKMMQKTQFKVH